jgi:hypothetical protein
MSAGHGGGGRGRYRFLAHRLVTLRSLATPTHQIEALRDSLEELSARGAAEGREVAADDLVVLLARYVRTDLGLCLGRPVHAMPLARTQVRPRCVAH